MKNKTISSNYKFPKSMLEILPLDF